MYSYANADSDANDLPQFLVAVTDFTHVHHKVDGLTPLQTMLPLSDGDHVTHSMLFIGNATLSNLFKNVVCKLFRALTSLWLFEQGVFAEITVIFRHFFFATPGWKLCTADIINENVFQLVCWPVIKTVIIVYFEQKNAFNVCFFCDCMAAHSSL